MDFDILLIYDKEEVGGQFMLADIDFMKFIYFISDEKCMLKYFGKNM